MTLPKAAKTFLSSFAWRSWQGGGGEKGRTTRKKRILFLFKLV
jgi:hypothetical protein